jgi:single-strand DNA-binding protein
VTTLKKKGTKMLNKATIIGNLGQDPDLRKTQSGDSVCNLSIATTESWKSKDTGERVSKTEWHKVTIWGGTADVAAKYLSKGSKVYIEGKLETRKWQDQNGNDKYTTEIVVKGFGGQMVMLDGKSDSQPSQHDQAKANGYQPQSDGDDLDDIPFARINDKAITL